MVPVTIEIADGYVHVHRRTQTPVLHIDEAPDLLRQLQSLIRAHTIQTQNEDQPNA